MNEKMRNLNLLEACFIMGDSLALRMALASNKGSKATPNLLRPRNYLILLRVRLSWLRIEKVTFYILRTILNTKLGEFMLENLIMFLIMLLCRSGGLLVGFDSDMFDVREKELGEFMIRTLVIQKESGFIWNFINVYGAAQNDKKQKFLSELSSFCSKCSHPMLFGGDFNILRKDSDKNKPRGTNKWSSLFNSIIDVHELIELDLCGRLFTWSNNRNPPTYEKLDRFLVSPEWDLHYNNVNVAGLSRSFSDHVPLCLKTDFSSPAKRDFRYELCWRLRHEFRTLVVKKWSLPVRSKKSIDIWKEKTKRLKKC
jgi:hypothetical protein